MGYNYERVLNFLERYLVIMIVLAVATYFVFIALANGDYWNVTSFSYSLTPYNSIMFIVIWVFARILKQCYLIRFK